MLESCDGPARGSRCGGQRPAHEYHECGCKHQEREHKPPTTQDPEEVERSEIRDGERARDGKEQRGEDGDQEFATWQRGDARAVPNDGSDRDEYARQHEEQRGGDESSG